MRHAMPREFYLPRESQGRMNIETMTAEDAVIYTYTTTRGQLGAMAFHGKAAKPDWHFTFTTAESRAKKIAEYIEGRKARATMMAELKKGREVAHTMKVGDILVCSWGYDQTNIDYYQVTRVPGPMTVEIRQIAKKSGPEEGFMTAYCTPARDHFIGEPMTKRVNRMSVRIASYASAYPWDGKADRYSWYA